MATTLFPISASAATKSKKILVVDDDVHILEAVKLMLEASGYEVRVSADTSFLNSFHEGDFPDLILLDVLLTGIDGREIAYRLKKEDDTKHIPIIMFSAHLGTKHSSFNYGADDFLPKPFEADDLLGKIEKLV